MFLPTRSPNMERCKFNERKLPTITIIAQCPRTLQNNAYCIRSSILIIAFLKTIFKLLKDTISSASVYDLHVVTNARHLNLADAGLSQMNWNSSQELFPISFFSEVVRNISNLCFGVHTLCIAFTCTHFSRKQIFPQRSVRIVINLFYFNFFSPPEVTP